MVKIIASVVGCGRMGAFTSESVKKYSPKSWFPLSHVEAIQKNNDIEIEAICDKSKKIRNDIKKIYKIKKIYSNYDELIDNCHIDILCIATRTNDKFKIIQKAKKKGINYFHIEKPICNTTDELNELKKFIKLGLVFTYGTIRRYMKPYIDAKKMIEKGKFGKLNHIDINFGHGQLLWTHPHSVDLLLFFTNDKMPLSVQAKLSKINYKKKEYSISIENDPYIESATFFFEQEVTGNINNHGNCDVILFCEQGTISINADGANIVTRKKIINHPYKYRSKKLVEYNQNILQGSYTPIKILSDKIKKNNFFYNSNHIILGQEIIFSLVMSHINESKLIKPGAFKDKVEILGITDNKYA